MTVQAEIRGNRLDGATSVWFDAGGLKARILKVETVKEDFKRKINLLEKQKAPQTIYRAVVEIQIERTIPPGVYPLRLVSPRGVSNPIGFPVMDEPLVVEGPGSHQTAELAMAVTLPAVINGKVGEAGELDYYSFHAKKGEQLRFETVEGAKFDKAMASRKFAPEVALYRAGGSWFDPHRPTRLLFREERSSDLMQKQSGGTYRFDEDGQYLLQVSGLFGQGCPDCTYRVRVVSGERIPKREAQLAETKGEWSERSLSRELKDDWMKELEDRTVPRSKSKTQAKDASSAQGGNPNGESKQPPELPSHPSSLVLSKTSEDAAQAQSISIPAVLEGTIQHPSDLDSFKLKIEAGQKLAFEVETPDAKPPYFNPRLGIVDSQNRELFSNVERRLSMFNNNADPQVYLKDVEPKVIYTFERGGEYVLQVRDITSRYGRPDYHYKILVRPQIPHVGQVSVGEGQSAEGSNAASIDRINLVPGTPKRLTLTASYEEGFTGDLSFVFTGLPEGVQTFPAVQFHEDRAPLEATQNPEIVAPKIEKATIVLLAGADAKLTSEPHVVQLYCRMSVDGKLGPNLLVQEVPLMVVAGQSDHEEKLEAGK